MNYNDIISQLPYSKPFLFVDVLNQVNAEGVEGTYTFSKELDFYQGHFKGNPVTPGVILTECCAQIGLVCLGIHLLAGVDLSQMQIGFSSSEMEFLLPVHPGETVTVRSEKVYFRFNKLKCTVRLYNEAGALACKGVLSGMFKTQKDGA